MAMADHTALPFSSYVFRRTVGSTAAFEVIVTPGPADRVEVGEVRYGDPYGLAWHQLGNALWDVLSVLGWMLVAGSVAVGACWCMGQFMYSEWVREHPPPRLRFFAERSLRRDVARGLGDLEEYLRERDPAHLDDTAARAGRTRAWRRRGRRSP